MNSTLLALSFTASVALKVSAGPFGHEPAVWASCGRRLEDVPVLLRQHGPAQDGLWALDLLEARKDKAVAAFLHGPRGLGAGEPRTSRFWLALSRQELSHVLGRASFFTQDERVGSASFITAISGPVLNLLFGITFSIDWGSRFRYKVGIVNASTSAYSAHQFVKLTHDLLKEREQQMTRIAEIDAALLGLPCRACGAESQAAPCATAASGPSQARNFLRFKACEVCHCGSRPRSIDLPRHRPPGDARSEGSYHDTGSLRCGQALCR